MCLLLCTISLRYMNAQHKKAWCAIKDRQTRHIAITRMWYRQLQYEQHECGQLYAGPETGTCDYMSEVYSMQRNSSLVS